MSIWARSDGTCGESLGYCVGLRFSVRRTGYRSKQIRVSFIRHSRFGRVRYSCRLGKRAGGLRFPGTPVFFIKFAEFWKTRPKLSPAGPNYSETAFKSGKNYSLVEGQIPQSAHRLAAGRMTWSTSLPRQLRRLFPSRQSHWSRYEGPNPWLWQFGTSDGRFLRCGVGVCFDADS